MSYDVTFGSSYHKARKDYVCDHCVKPINAGAKYYKQTGIWEGDFYTFRAHSDCVGAADALHTNAERYDDEAMLLHIEYGEEPDETGKFLLAEYPVVAERMGIKQPRQKNVDFPAGAESLIREVA
ncbi:hypothetical protein LCGC14_3091360 [marine sediment metagenome]|uniref:Uncharacterized protein n=1 Tax=marine sediment metagenome TaxID=412755 RepID=A0A0F8YHS9_9ZZZZ